jgi:hypothetical protein
LKKYSGVCAGEGQIRWLKPLLSKGFSVLTRLNTAIEGLTRRDRREIKQRLITLFEHALKCRYVSLQDCYRGWEVTLKRTQSKLRDIPDDSPSLHSYFSEIIPLCYQEALETVRIEYDAFFSDDYLFPEKLNLLLTQTFWTDK